MLLPSSALFLGALSCLHYAEGYSKSAPCVSLLTMRPSSVYHGTPQDPKEVPPPYSLKVLDENGKEVSSYQAGKTYTVRLSGKEPFKGFLIQPRMASEKGKIIGHFRVGQFIPETDWEQKGIEFQNCATANQDSVTHSNPSPKFQVVVKWSSDSADNAVQFAASIVVNQTYFWAQWLPESGYLTAAGGGIVKASTAAATDEPAVQTTEASPESASKKFIAEVTKSSKSATEESAASSTEASASSKSPSGSTDEPPKGSSASGQNTTGSGAETSGSTAEATTAGAGTSTVGSVDGTTTPATTLGVILHRGPADGPPPRGPKGQVGSGDAKPALPIDDLGNPNTIGTDFNPFAAAAAGAGGAGGQTSPKRGPAGLPVVILQPQKPEEPSGSGPSGGQLSSSSRGNAPPSGERCPGPSNPCLHNGTCYTDPENEYTCVCTAGWAGKECADRDQCSKIPCKNGANCVNDLEKSSFSCECTPGWAGETCEKSCPSYICKNGGTCKLDSNGDFACNCQPGWTGKSCDTEIDECQSNPCLHGGQCRDKLNGFTCTCKKGYTGDHCQRPCLNVYKSCERWREEDRCESMRHLTKFFDVNCPITCQTCEGDEATMHIDYPPYPPTLEPFHWMIGRWHGIANFSTHFPIDFETGVEGYNHTLSILVNEVPMFGTPSLNYTLWAVSNRRPDDVQSAEGFLTLKRSPETNKTAALFTVSNNGVNLIEEGAVKSGEKQHYMELKSVYNATVGYMKYRIPAQAVRIFTLEGEKLRVKVRKTDHYGAKKEFSIVYTRSLKRKLY